MKYSDYIDFRDAQENIEYFLRHINFHAPDGDTFCCYKCRYLYGKKETNMKVYISCQIINKIFGQDKYSVLLNDNNYFFWSTCNLFEDQPITPWDEPIDLGSQKAYIVWEGTINDN